MSKKILMNAEALEKANAERKKGIDKQENLFEEAVRKQFLKSVKCDIPIYRVTEIKTQHLEEDKSIEK